MDQRPLAAPHGFSQRATSFIASWHQGIHRMPFSHSRLHYPEALPHPGAPHHTPPPQTSSRTPKAAMHSRLHTPRNIPRHAPTPLTEDQNPDSERPPPPLNPPKSQDEPSQAPSGQTRDPARPEAHQNLIHPDKEHATPYPQGSQPHSPRPDPGSPPRHQTATATLSSPPASQTNPAPPTLEAIGLEPTTPCLQSRRSPAELRPHPMPHHQHRPPQHRPPQHRPHHSGPTPAITSTDHGQPGPSNHGPGRI